MMDFQEPTHLRQLQFTLKVSSVALCDISNSIV